MTTDLSEWRAKQCVVLVEIFKAVSRLVKESQGPGVAPVSGDACLRASVELYKEFSRPRHSTPKEPF